MNEDAGLCECGCGRPAPIATRTDAHRGAVKGQPRRFIQGHSGNKGRRLDLTDAYRVDDNGCWVWQRSIHRTGYASIGHAYGRGLAHRYFYERAHGSIPDGMTLDHLCRNRACVNPAHLEVVTNAENCRRGANAKLTHEKVAVIRERIATGESLYTIAEDYGVSYWAIQLIRAGKTWVV